MSRQCLAQQRRVIHRAADRLGDNSWTETVAVRRPGDERGCRWAVVIELRSGLDGLAPPILGVLADHGLRLREWDGRTVVATV